LKILYHHRTQGKRVEGVHIREVIKALEHLNHEIILVSPPGIDPFCDAEPSKRNISKLSNFWSFLSDHLPQVFFELLEILYNIVAIRNLVNILKNDNIHFIYERYAFYCFSGVLCSKIFNVPIILEVNEISGIARQRAQLFTPLAKKIEKIIFAKSDAIIAVSSYLKKSIEKHGVDPSKIYIMPNAVDITQFDRKNEQVSLREIYGFDRSIIIGFVGSFSVWDNLQFLISIFDDLYLKRGNLKLFLVGDGYNKEELEEEVKIRGLDKHVVFAGRVKRNLIPDYISVMDICTLPHSNPFGSPVALFEYMAMAKPVVVPKIGPIEDVITHDYNGLLFEPGNSDSFIRQLIKLIDHKEIRIRLGRNAKDTILKNHLWKHNAEKIINIYNSLIDGN